MAGRTFGITFAPVVDCHYVNLYARDITNQKEAEDELRFRNVILSTQQEASIDGILVVDENARIISYNRRFIEMWGLPVELVEDKHDEPVLQFVAAQTTDEPSFLRRVQFLYEHRQETGRDEIALKDGRTFDRYSAPMFSLDAQCYGRVWYFRDITERKQAEAELVRISQKTELVLNSVVEGILGLDLQGNHTFVNPAAASMLGYTVEELLGRSGHSIWHHTKPDGSPCSTEECPIHAVYSDGAVHRSSTDVFWRKDGTSFPVEYVSTPIHEQDRLTGVVVTFEDITERKQTEAERETLQTQLTQAQKMDSVGRLAGGVAHDFNNMLQIILGDTELALGKTDPSDPLFSSLQEIHDATVRSADLTRQLLAFAREQPSASKIMNLNDEINSMLNMLRRFLREEVVLTWRPGANLYPAKLDPSQIDQILVNLCVNAQDAIHGNGKIIIETENVKVDKTYCQGHAEAVPGDYIVLKISDTGCGIDTETMGHIFEPFFTTKGVEKGTGLGLATVYGIVKQNGGFIYAYSEPGHGTTFRIYLPQAAEKTAKIGATAPTSAAQGRGETILLVEDNPSLQKVYTRFIDGLGYTLLSAETPEEALRLSGLHPDIHLLLTDVVMPGMNGRQLAEKIRETHPGIQVLFMSGYTADILIDQGVQENQMTFIAKPFSRAELANKLRALLEP